MIAGGVLVGGCANDNDLVGNHPISADGFPPITGETTNIAGSVIDAGNGCLFLKIDETTRHWVVWPEGSQRESESSGLSLADGQVVRTGDDVEVIGQLQTRSALPGGEDPESSWGALAQFCLGAAVVEDELIRATEVRLT